ncbi:MAG: insulinase family protein [Bacteroidetes bacterium]|nr:insulinase family protein [Bacteroidota bacterium]MCL1969165.1 insulinase family protein [Bacteroidota bacterium]
MQKHFKFLFTLLISMALFTAFAQKTDLKAPLPMDPRIITGKLDNGLTYYIRENKKPENRAIFFLSVDAGSVIERDDQLGLAHFTEHMGFNGTKQFPGNTLVSDLEKKGIIFGRDINANTGFEATQYFVNLPTDDKELFNMGLKILDGWAFGLLMTEEEIDKERGVIIEEWRLYQNAEERMWEKTLPILFKGSQFAKRNVIGTLEYLQTFPYQAIRDYYKQWYRPDNMAIIVVGDFDGKEMEKQVKDFFTMNNKPTTPLNRPYYEIPGNKEPIIVILTDPEATSSQFEIIFKQPKSEIKTYGDYRRDLVSDLIAAMMNARFNELAEKKTTPFNSAYGYLGGYYSRKNDAFQIGGDSKEGKLLASLELSLAELKRIDQHGFLSTEFERAKTDYYTYAEKAAKEANKTNSVNHSYRYSRAFFDKNPVVGDSINFEIVKTFLYDITLEEVNEMAKTFITEENISCVLTMPEKKELKVPTEKEVLGIINKFNAMKTKPYVDNVNTLPFLAKNPTPGKVTKRTVNEKFNYVELQLSNGATVIIKNTDFKNDEIRFTAFSPGGSSLYEANQLPNVSYATAVINDCGIGNYSQTDYSKFMTGKNYYLYSNINAYEEAINGSTAPKDLETFLQHLYMMFEAPRKDKEVFDRNIAQWKEQVVNYENNPEWQYSKFSAKVRYPNNPRLIFMEEKTIKAMNLDQMFKIYNERFANATDFTFVFVGNMDIDKSIPLIEKYIGGIPMGKKEKIINRDFPMAKGVVDESIYFGIADKTLMGHFTQLPYVWNAENNLANSALNNIMNIKMTENIREKLGGTYGARFSLSPTKVPVEKINLTVSLGCQPERVNEMTTEIWRTIDEVIENGPTQLDLDKAKEQMIRFFEVGMKENNNWISWLKNYYDQGVEISTLDEYKDKVNALTVERIKKAAQYMKHDENVRTILMPEARKQ